MNFSELNFLVVEDDAFQRSLLINMLTSLEVATITSVENGKQALEVVRNVENSGPVHIALCDLNMPEMDGMEFLRHLGKEHHNIAIIITSALDGKLLESVAKMANMYGMKLLGTIEKPVTLTPLKRLLASYSYVEGKKPQTPQQVFTLDEILRGIEADQFEPYFQPKVDIKTGQLTGAEALARWIHTEHGVIGPYAFIPLLEQNGYIDTLTFIMLEKSAIKCNALHKKGYHLTISVNLSLSSLNDPELANKITHIVRNIGIDPKYMILEITEWAAMTDVAVALENLTRLCMNGFMLSIDDYGTGYSSLQQLTRIPFSELKIDQSLVQGMATNTALRIVVESSIDMAYKLRVRSVAEGVETRQDWDALKALGCDYVQGYFVAHPMDARAFEHFVANYHTQPDI